LLHVRTLNDVAATDWILMDPSNDFHIEIDAEHRDVIVAGEVDIVTSPAITDATAELNDDGPGDINLDLDEVTFIDASGVSAVVAADEEQTRRHTELHVRSCNAFVRRVFTLCGLGRLVGGPSEPRHRKL
jgi:anti-anti-sigma factor